MVTDSQRWDVHSLGRLRSKEHFRQGANYVQGEADSAQGSFSGKVWKWKSLSCVRLCDPMDYIVHGILQARILEVGSFSLQGIFPTQGLNPGFPHYRQILYQLSHKGSPRILERVAYPFSSRSAWPRNWTRVSCTAGGFFTNWIIKEAPSCSRVSCYYVYGMMMLLTPHSWTWTWRF